MFLYVQMAVVLVRQNYQRVVPVPPSVDVQTCKAKNKAVLWRVIIDVEYALMEVQSHIVVAISVAPIRVYQVRNVLIRMKTVCLHAVRQLYRQQISLVPPSVDVRQDQVTVSTVSAHVPRELLDLGGNAYPVGKELSQNMVIAVSALIHVLQEHNVPVTTIVVP